MRAGAARVACSRVPKASLEGNPGAKPVEVRAVCTNPGCLWKGLRGRFFRLYDRQMERISARLPRTCQKFHKGPACGNKIKGKRHFEGERLGPILRPILRPILGPDLGPDLCTLPLLNRVINTLDGPVWQGLVGF